MLGAKPVSRAAVAVHSVTRTEKNTGLLLLYLDYATPPMSTWTVPSIPVGNRLNLVSK